MSRLLQEWFAEVLRTPLQGVNIDVKHVKTAAAHIPATPLLKPHERLEIYNQQYWWRLFSALQNILPSVTEYLGKTRFNETIAEPYLLAHNPEHWALYYLGDHVIPWMRGKVAPLVFQLAELDWAFYDIFLKPVIETPLNPEKRFYLQPHVKLLYIDTDLLTFRRALLDLKKPKSPKKKSLSVYLYRVPYSGKTYWDDLLPEEELLLKAFEKGSTLEEALEGIAENPAWDIQASFATFAERKLIYNRDSDAIS